MALNAKPKMYLRVSIDVSDNEYGGSLHYATVRFELDADSPIATATADAQQAVGQMIRAGMQLPDVRRAAEKLRLALESPEMPGPGYDAQTRPIDGS